MTLAHQTGQFVVDDFDDLLTGCQARHDFVSECPLLDTGDELLDNPIMNIGLEKRHSHFFEPVFDVFLRKLSVALQCFKNRIQFIA